MISNVRRKDFRPAAPSMASVHGAQTTPLDSETDWYGELWSKTNLLK